MTIAAAALVYLVAIDPFAYFRHDDWLILGNAVGLPRHWQWLWNPTLFGPEGERVWFFRPGFKLATWLFYEAFGLHYWLWLLATQALTALATYWGARALGANGLYFAGLFAASFTIHLGSLFWIGEGLMNCPQLALLCLNLLLFTRGKLFAALAVWIVALGFKESSVFHVLFLGGWVWTSADRRVKTLLPYAVGAAVYLLVRLLALPVNPEYLAHPTASGVLRSVGSLTLILSLTPLTTCLLGGQSGAWRKYWPYLPYFAVSLVPYIGHQFFSPGWALVPGFFLVWLAAKAGPVRHAPTIALGISLALSLGWMAHVHWWSWGTGQRNVHQFLKNLEREAKTVVIYECPSNPNVPSLTFQRAIAHPAGLWHLWRLYHEGEMEFRVYGCWTPSPSEGLLFLKWDFPRLERFFTPPG